VPARFDRRLGIVAAAGVVIALAVAWRLLHPPPALPRIARDEFLPRPFAARDERRRLVRMETYLGRHPLVVAFVDPSGGLESHPFLLALRERFDELKSRNARLFVVTPGTTQLNLIAAARAAVIAGNPRAASGFPFPLLSDAELTIHRAWGLFDEERGRTVEAVFVIGRSGVSRWYRVGELPAELDAMLRAVDESR